MPAIFLNIPSYVETLDWESADSLVEVVEAVVERYQEQPVSCLLVW